MSRSASNGQARNDRDIHKPEWPRGLYRRGDSYRYRRMVDGRKLCDVWGIMPEQDAIDRATQYALDLRQGRDPIKNHTASATTFHDFAYDVWLKQKQTVLRPTSLTKYRSVLDNFDYFLTHHRKLQGCHVKDIDYGVARDFITHRQTAPIMPNGSRRFTRAFRDGAAKKTVCADRAVLNQLFNEAVKRGLTKENPFKDVDVPRVTDYEVRQKHHPLTTKEAKRLLAAAEKSDAKRAQNGNARLADVILFMLFTGMRAGEVEMLEWTDLDWQNGLIHVHQKTIVETRILTIPKAAVRAIQKIAGNRTPDQPLFRDQEHVQDVCRKVGMRLVPGMMELKVGDLDLAAGQLRLTRQEEWKPKASQGDVPMCQQLRELLDRLRADAPGNQFVFQHHDGGRCRLKLLNLLKAAQRDAEIKGNLRVHDLRHTCAVWLRKQGVALETIMGILRHADIRETQIYAPYHLEEGKKAILRLDGMV
ncbi:MAG: tyrosine-type recombinase/integrase [Lentisphaerae bacterium]|jgi:integrase|nr:tyrosine-type recombinase/integrase [Lentisphaerota bacterium]